jgi:pimeloyl-ACP methyl ester carboxylesterase
VIGRPPPREHRFAAPGGALCWFEWGQARADRPSLLLIHATGFHARCWDQVVAALPSDWHIVALEIPGHGRSFTPDDLLDWGWAAQQVGALLPALDAPRFVAVGHSMGGHLLARIAAAAPERFARLLLVDPVIFAPEIYAATAGQPAPDPAQHPVARRRAQWDSAEQMVAHFAERPPYALWQRAVLEDYCRYGLLPEGDAFTLACPPRIEASAYLGATRRDPLPLLARLTMPATVLRARVAERAGALDFSISPTWPGLAAHLPQGRDLHWQDQSHFIPMDAPDRLAALIRDEMAAAKQG